MEVHFTPEQEAQLSAIANQAGTDPEHLVKSAALRPLERDARFRAAVRKGLEPADRGEFVEREIEARIDRMLQPNAHPVDPRCRRRFATHPRLSQQT
jgi:predicted transcriptional regulator